MSAAPRRSRRGSGDSTDLSGIGFDGSGLGRRITADYVADALREAIQSGTLGDRAVLNQAAIAAYFGISRVPVREAMRQLLAEGLIESEAHHLAVVAELTPERLGETYDNRALLEGYLVERAVPNVTPELLAELRELELEMRGIEDHAEWMAANVFFHEMLNGQAGDVTGMDLVAGLRARAARYARRWGKGADVHRPGEAGSEHSAILDCVERRDATAAREAVERHIRHTGERLVAYGRVLRAGEAAEASGDASPPA